MTVVLTGTALAIEDVVRVAREREQVELAPEALERMRAARTVAEQALAEGRSVYGLTTGVASRKRAAVTAEDVAAFNKLLIQSHRVGQGAYAPEDAVRATLVRLANGFATGTTAARPELAEHVVASLNGGAAPRVRLLGSVGQADLAPNADLAHGILDGFELAAGEALALVNNNSFSTGLATLAVADAERLLASLEVAGALDLEAFAANLSILHPAVARTRPYTGLRTTLERMRALSRAVRSGSPAPRATCRTRSASAASRRCSARFAMRSPTCAPSSPSSSTRRSRTRSSSPRRGRSCPA